MKIAFSPMENKNRRKLQYEFIMLDMPFTTLPNLDKMIAGECSKSTKANDSLFSDIQTHFLDAVWPLTGTLETINGGTQLAIEDVEGINVPTSVTTHRVYSKVCWENIQMEVNQHLQRSQMTARQLAQ